jgi:hypothetical protein
MISFHLVKTFLKEQFSETIDFIRFFNNSAKKTSDGFSEKTQQFQYQRQLEYIQILSLLNFAEQMSF